MWSSLQLKERLSGLPFSVYSKYFFGCLSQCDSFLSSQLPQSIWGKRISAQLCAWMIAKVEIGMSTAAQKPNIYIFALVIANFEFIIECRLLFSGIMFALLNVR